MTSRLLRSVLAFSYIGLLAVAGCGGGAEDDDAHPSSCAMDDRADTYMVGLERASAASMFKVRLVSATPASPDRGNNMWTMEILDMSDAPLTGVTNAKVKAWMPDHGHGTNPLWNEATPQADGKFQVGPFNLFMPGLWQFTFSVETAGMTDESVISFCVQG